MTTIDRRPTRKPCDAQPDLWFSHNPVDQYEAIQACGLCPFREACAVYGDDEIYGIWGGVLKGRPGNKTVQPWLKTCEMEGCGKEFVVRTATAKYCSKSCQDDATNAARRMAQAQRRVCAYESCNIRFIPSMKTQRYCSTKCGQRQKTIDARKRDRKVRANENLRLLLSVV